MSEFWESKIYESEDEILFEKSFDDSMKYFEKEIDKAIKNKDKKRLDLISKMMDELISKIKV